MISKYRLFVIIFIPAALVLALGLALLQEKNSRLSEAQFEAQLKSQWQLAALIAEDPAYQGDLNRLNQAHGLRVTVVDQNGSVLADSAVEGGLEPHRDRDEIKMAAAGQPTMVVRSSRTTGTHTIYYAEKLADGRVLRVAYPAAYYDAQKNSLLDQALTGLLLLMAAVALFALIVSKKTSNMLAALSRAVKEAQNGGLDLPAFDNDDLDKALFSLSAATRELRIYTEDNLRLQERLEYILANIEEGVLLLADDQVLYRNRRAEEILNLKLPATLRDLTSREMIDVFASFSAGQTGDMQLGDKNIVVSQAVSDQIRLIMLHDVSDREKYSGYKSDLVGNISHELKTPLTLIMGASEVILKDADMPRQFLDKFLNTIYKNSHRINILLDDLILLHQLEGRQELRPEETDLMEVIGDLKDLLGPTDKKVNYHIDAGSVRIHATHLLSVLTNLISNANKYSHGETIEVEVRKNGGALEIKVSDQGPPLAPSESQRIFERFYTVSKSRNRGESGSGLGLSIVKHVARIYRGQAFLDPDNQEGNTFVVRLVEK